METCVKSKDRFVRIAVNAQGEVLGWIGAISLYDGKVYEIHPLCVRADSRKAGIGLSLVKDLEVQVYKKAVLLCTWAPTTKVNKPASPGLIYITIPGIK